MQKPVGKKRDREAFNRVTRAAPRMSAMGRRVLKFITEHRELVLASTAAELAERIETSDATVVRTVQALGFSGLAELKHAILDSLRPESTPADDMRRSLAELQASTEAAVDNVMQTHADAMKVVRSEACRMQIEAAVHVLDGAQRIVIFGIGPSASLATYASMMLIRSGRRSRVLDATGSMLADQLLELCEGDAVLVLAYTSLYREVAAVFREAKALGVPIILITEAEGTQLAGQANFVISIPRGRPYNTSLHGATFVGLEALIFSLAAARPENALASLERLNDLRTAVSNWRMK